MRALISPADESPGKPATSRRPRRGAGLALAAGLAAITAAPRSLGETASPAPPSPAEIEGIVFERQQLMQQLDKDAETLGNIVAGVLPKARLAEVTRSIAEGARDSVAAFKDVAPGGRAKPEVWSNHAEFMRDMEAFASKAQGMAKAGENGDVDAVTGLMVDALPCKQCHDRYRGPKPP